jgi:hypothetical protein
MQKLGCSFFGKKIHKLFFPKQPGANYISILEARIFVLKNLTFHRNVEIRNFSQAKRTLVLFK